MDFKTQINNFILSLNKNNFQLFLQTKGNEDNTIKHFYRLRHKKENIVLHFVYVESDNQDTYIFVYKDGKLDNNYYGTIDTVIENYSKENLKL